MLSCVCKPSSNYENTDLAEQKKRSKAIEQQLQVDKKEHSSTHRLLLLGAGESGKSTVVKQMKIINLNGYTDQERREKRLDIKKNVRDSCVSLLQGMEQLNLKFEGYDDYSIEKLIEFRTFVYSQTEIMEEKDKHLEEKVSEEDFSDLLFERIKILWDDEGVQESYKRSNEFQLIDCAKYFLDQVEEISKDDYLPSNQDILRSRPENSYTTDQYNKENSRAFFLDLFPHDVVFGPTV